MLKLVVIGNLVADPRIGEQNGQSVGNARIAAHTPFRDANNEYITNFINVSVWGKATDALARLHKGDKVAVTGNFCVKLYKDKNGVQQIDITCRADTIESETPRKAEQQDDIFT